MIHDIIHGQEIAKLIPEAMRQREAVKPEPEWRTLYELTGDIKDINTVLINRNELRSLIR